MGGHKLWVAGEELLDTDLQEFLADQIVAVFANATARDAWTSPPDGACAITLDTNTKWQRIGGVWWAPFTRLAKTVKSTTTTGVGTLGFDLAATGSITLPDDRMIRFVGKVNLTTATTSGAYIVGKVDGSNVTTRLGQMNNINGGATVGGTESVVVAAGAHTFTLGVVGIGTTVDIVGATDPSFYEIWDAGPG